MLQRSRKLSTPRRLDMAHYKALLARTVGMAIVLAAAACADDGAASLGSDGGPGAADSGDHGNDGKPDSGMIDESDSGEAVPDLTSPTITSTFPVDEATRA